jgi:two-component system, OmpR family, sensor kinase
MPRGWTKELFESRKIELSPGTLLLFEPAATNEWFFIAWSPSGRVLARSTNGPTVLARPTRVGSAVGTYTRTRDEIREAYQFTEIGDCILVGRPIGAELQAIRGFAGWLVFAGAAILTLGLGGGWLLANRVMRPLEQIGVTASRISGGNLAERINVADTDSELGRLAEVLNSTFGRLETAFAQQKQFVADASHELRTPIAVMISEAQTTLARERTAAEYRETLEGCLATAQEMRQLTQSLLELARYDAGQEPLEREPLDIAAQARACIQKVEPLSSARGISIHADLQPARTQGDTERLNRVLINLLTNAIHYNRDGGQVRVSTRTDGGAVVIAVTDTGAGIAPQDLPRVFERFYRADPARKWSQDGHSGLGLAISKAIVEAHGGTIEAKSPPDQGAVFTIRLPV